MATILRSTFTPTVVWYFSENFEWTNYCTRLVLPVPKTPTMQTFFWVTVVLHVDRLSYHSNARQQEIQCAQERATIATAVDGRGRNRGECRRQRGVR